MVTKRWISKADIAVRANHLTATGNHVPYGITQCYLQPGSSDFLSLLPQSWYSKVAKASTSFGWGISGKVTAAGWQVTLCDHIWQVISRSSVMISITNCYICFALCKRATAVLCTLVARRPLCSLLHLQPGTVGGLTEFGFLIYRCHHRIEQNIAVIRVGCRCSNNSK